MLSRALRPVIAACFAFGFCAVFGAPACTKTYSCTGDFETKDCAGLDADTCTKVHGCRARKPACMNGCDLGLNCDQTGACAHPADGSCTSLCATAFGESDCNELTASIGGPSLHECEWTTDDTDGGSSCQSVCLPLKNETACTQQAAAGCSWVACEGKVNDDCSSYSGDDCPTFLGCDRTSDAVP
ncbi:MAG TPA: hypothetical protein VHC69_02855 [Polyangiaceae bacterium]|nr:hypothetical protein [Polyangiaceae bacterium]